MDGAHAGPAVTPWPVVDLSREVHEGMHILGFGPHFWKWRTHDYMRKVYGGAHSSES